MDEIRLSSFLTSLEPETDEDLYRIRQEALKDSVPVIRPETEALLVFLLELKKPDRILEVGCAIGYSAIVMAKKRTKALIDTIENYEPRFETAEKHFSEASVKDRVTLHKGDATGILKDLVSEKKTYDLIFMDAAKGQYIHWLEDCLKLLKCGGLLISDNVLYSGDILEARTVVDRRDRTIHKRMREYLYTLKHREDLESAVLPIGDGVALTIKKEGKRS